MGSACHEASRCLPSGRGPCAQAHEKVPGAADQPGAEPGWAKTLSVPPRGKVSWPRTAQGKDTLSALGRGEPAVRGIPLPSARTFPSLTESPFWAPRQSPWVSGRSGPKPASRTCFCLARGDRGISPRAALGGGMGLAAGGSTIPFWRELPGELPLLLLTPPVDLSDVLEYVPPDLVRLQPSEDLGRSWGKVPAPTGKHHPSAPAGDPFCLGPRPASAPTRARRCPPFHPLVRLGPWLWG